MDPSATIPPFLSQAPAVAASLVIVWAFLRHLSDESQRHLAAASKRDELFTAALAEIRVDIRAMAGAAREADVAVAQSVGELTGSVGELTRLQEQLADATERMAATAAVMADTVDDLPGASKA